MQPNRSAHRRLATAQFEIGPTAGAIASIRRALEFDPGDVQARRGLQRAGATP